VCAATGCAFPGRRPVGLRRAIPRVVLLRTVATCCRYLALGSYVAIFLTLEALLQATLSFVPLALEQLALPDQAFVDDLVCVFRLSELNYYR
jgi:hypothetical protein